MASAWLLAAALSALLPAAAALIGCPDGQYVENLHGTDVCCSYCPAAGEEIVEVCTPWNKASKCKKCSPNRYNPKNARVGCQQCTVCNKERGSFEKVPCTNCTNTVCDCPEGSVPTNPLKSACKCAKGREIVNNKCQPCKPGYFSTIENGVCRPWTNCSAKGETILEQGSAIKDVKCNKPSPVTIRIPSTTLTPSSSTDRRTTSLQNVTKNQISINTSSTSSKSIDWATLLLILIGAFLLLLSAGIILAMITQINRKKMHRRFNRLERVRVPVQEESTTSDSSIPKDCSL